VPITWQKQDQNWQTVYQTADAIAPMCVGTLVDEEGVNNWSRDVQHSAIQSLKAAQKKMDYVGVVWPGNEVREYLHALDSQSNHLVGAACQ
jgi:hypothetical protein